MVKRGFTVVELLVVMSIFTVITTLILVSSSKFNSDTAVKNLAYDIALIIRQAQVYGISAREFGVGSGSFNYRYGIHFNASNPDTIIMYADSNANNTYDGVLEQVDVYTLKNGNTVSSLCVTPPSGPAICGPTITRVDLLFKRPNPDALIHANPQAGVYQSAEMTLRAANGTTQRIVVYSTGQISIQ